MDESVRPRDRPAADCSRLHLQVLEVRLVFRLHIELDAVFHAPVQHLVVDRQVDLVFLHLVPDIGDDSVALGEVSLRFQRHDLGVHIGIVGIDKSCGSWADALIESEQWDKALTRFSIPWEWGGGEAILQSRATDSAGNVQLTRQAVIDDRGTGAFYHNPGIQSWAVNTQGEVSNIAV